MTVITAMLRWIGLDDESMDREEARLRREFQLIQAERESLDQQIAELDAVADELPIVARCWLSVAKVARALRDFAARRMARALADAERWRP